nr:retrovirus-related Pol polyprotein from transposon TNT 1-94 [Tanacetum cinerariifolium]
MAGSQPNKRTLGGSRKPDAPYCGGEMMVEAGGVVEMMGSRSGRSKVDLQFFIILGWRPAAAMVAEGWPEIGGGGGNSPKKREHVKCVPNDNHYLYVLHYINGVNSSTNMPMAVPISTREPKRNVNQSVATLLKKTVDEESTNHNPKSKIRKQYEHKSTCYIRNLKGDDILTGSYGIDLYSITLQDTSTLDSICLMAKASSSQAWLLHRRLSHLNFDTVNLLSKYDIVTGLPKLKFVKDHLCSSCELKKAKRDSFKTKTTPSSKRRLQILHMDLCGPMRVESFNGKKYCCCVKSSVVTAVDAPDKRQLHNTTPSTSTTVVADPPPLNIQTTPATTSQAPTITSAENINQSETHKENIQVEEDEFINICSTPVQE